MAQHIRSANLVFNFHRFYSVGFFELFFHQRQNVWALLRWNDHPICFWSRRLFLRCRLKSGLRHTEFRDWIVRLVSLDFLRPKSFILDLVYISKSRQVRLAVNGRTLLSATSTCSGCFEYPLRASSDSKVESSIKSAVEEGRRPFVFTLMSTSPGIFPLRLSSPSLIEGVVQPLKTAKSRL